MEWWVAVDTLALRRRSSPWETDARCRRTDVAEREGFEPPDLSVNGFQDRRHKPLGHLSVKEHTRQGTIGRRLDVLLGAVELTSS